MMLQLLPGKQSRCCDTAALARCSRSLVLVFTAKRHHNTTRNTRHVEGMCPLSKIPRGISFFPFRDEQAPAAAAAATTASEPRAATPGSIRHQEEERRKGGLFSSTLQEEEEGKEGMCFPPHYRRRSEERKSCRKCCPSHFSPDDSSIHAFTQAVLAASRAPLFRVCQESRSSSVHSDRHLSRRRTSCSWHGRRGARPTPGFLMPTPAPNTAASHSPGARLSQARPHAPASCVQRPRSRSCNSKPASAGWQTG
ncbi:hypothetical protein O3P69_009029 [Scylla paramamosain]|uniref:Uncharacterized protein n=1 Tax=Scylla paramamosain TaxID=85552 RepID=A0AAW0TSU4_SCYPA